MLDLFMQGNPFIMSLITLSAAGVVYYSVVCWRNDNHESSSQALLLVGALSLMLGIIGQSIGLVQILNVAEQAGEAPPALFTTGIKNTFIPLVYGGFWFLLALGVRYAAR